MSLHLERKDLVNTQQMEVAVNGPDGATHLILCTGMANMQSAGHETWTFFVGPQLSRRQFVAAIASGALSVVRDVEKTEAGEGVLVQPKANLVSIDASFDELHGHVKVSAQVSSSRMAMIQLTIHYNVSILAELLMY